MKSPHPHFTLYSIKEKEVFCHEYKIKAIPETIALHSPLTRISEYRMQLGKDKSENGIFILALHSPFTIFVP